MRLIDANKLLAELKSKLPIMSNWGEAFVPDLIRRQPTVDAEAVVRCRECKHCRELNRKDRIKEAYADGVLWCTNQSDGVWPDDFCSYGARKHGDIEND